nr:hypothetical protein [Tanacetum cinerariifolium]
MTHKEVEELVACRVAEEMEAHEAATNLEPLNENGDEQEGENGGNGNRGNEGNGNRGNRGNVNEGNKENRIGNRNRNHGINYGGFLSVARECTFQDFLKLKGNELTAYTKRFHELILLCTIMVPDEEDIVKRFIGGLPDNIQGNVIAANLASLQDAIRIANQLMDKKVQGYAARSAENKRRIESNPRDHHGQQPPFKRQNISRKNVARAYTAGNNKRRGMDCPKLRNQNRRNQTRNRVGNKTKNQTGGNKATARAYAIGGGGTNLNFNVVTGTFLLNNCCASMLFDSGADRSFVSSTFSAFLDVAPSTLDTSYAVELTNGRVSETYVVLRGCTLGLLGYPFDIDLMPIELDSFDVIIDRTDFASWQQRIRLYRRGKENGVNILKSIDEGPYQMGTVRETLAESTEGAPQFGLKRPRVYSDLTSEEKDRYNADI